MSDSRRGVGIDIREGGDDADMEGEDMRDSAKVVRERLGYEQVERVVDELVAWLDEGSL